MEKCCRHPGESVMFFCNDHRSLCCELCSSSRHRLCENIRFIPDISEDILDSREFYRFEKNLNALKDKSEKAVKHAECNVKTAVKQYQDVIQSLQELRESILDQFDRLCEKITEQAGVFKSQDLKKMKHVSDSGSNILDKVSTLLEDIDDLKASDNLCQLFILMIKTKEKLRLWKNEMDESSSDRKYLSNYKFEPGNSIQQILDGQVPFGVISTKRTVRRNPKHVKTNIHNQHRDTIGNPTTNFKDLTYLERDSENLETSYPNTESTVSGNRRCPSEELSSAITTDDNPGCERQLIESNGDNREHVALQMSASIKYSPLSKNLNNVVSEHLDNINVKSKKDVFGCNITGSAVLPGNKVLLSDHNNNKIKLVHVDSKAVTSELSLSSEPWDITAVTRRYAAVTLPHEEVILLVKVVEKTSLFLKPTYSMNIVRRISANGKCHGVVYRRGKLFVTFKEPAKLEILSLNGKVERSIETDDNGTEIFQQPGYLTISPNCQTIYVSDLGDHSIKAVTVDGRVLFQSKDLIEPVGLAVDNHSRLLVTDTSYLGRVSLLTYDCKVVKEFIYGLWKPRKISYCRNTSRLYVCLDGDYVSMHQLSF